MKNIFCIRPKGLNIGNNVIYFSMNYYLHKTFGSDINLIEIPATARYEAQVQAGLTPKTIYEINQYGHGVIIGGGNLYENNELDIDLDALEKLEVPLMLFSLSKGRIFNRSGQMVDRTNTMPDRIIKALNKATPHSYVRDQATLDYLHKIGCTHSKLCTCPSIFVKNAIQTLPVLHPMYDNRILISVRNPELMSIPLQQQVKVYDDIKSIISYFRDINRRDIYILCHDQRDIAFAASFTDVEYIYTSDLYTYLALLQNCSLNITYRLHSFLPCLSLNIPTINISYDERSLSLVESIGFKDWNINMLFEDNLLEKVVDNYHNLEYLNDLKRKNTKLWNNIDDIITKAFQSLADDVSRI